jgi:hypothetical protein
MLKTAGHLERVGRVKVSEKDTSPLIDHYEVRYFSAHDTRVTDMLCTDGIGAAGGSIWAIAIGSSLSSCCLYISAEVWLPSRTPADMLGVVDSVGHVGVYRIRCPLIT